MDDLILAVATHVQKAHADLDSRYRWKEIPKFVPSNAFKRGSDPLWSATRRLRECLAIEWKNSPDANSRLALAKWYVSSWGGVRGNSDSTLRDYVETNHSDLKLRPLAGVSSWSKILAMQHPNMYQIYDARVATSINAIQLLEGVGRGEVFLIPYSQQRTISRFRAERVHCPDYRSVPKKSYLDYLNFLAQVARRCEVHEEIVEMVLFADAKELAGKALAKDGAAFRQWL